MDALFEEKQQRVANIQRLEQELEQEGHMADNLVSAMKPKLRDRYIELKNQNNEYQLALEKMNQELDNLNARKVMLEDEVAISALKREALGIYENLRDLEQRRDELMDEESNRGTPAQERERLLAQVFQLIPLLLATLKLIQGLWVVEKYLIERDKRKHLLDMTKHLLKRKL